MIIVVTKENLSETTEYLNNLTNAVIGIDTESFGLKWSHKMFSLQLAIQNGKSFHFNFNHYPEDQNAPILDYDILKLLTPLWANANIRWIAANFKFDLRRLDIEGIQLNGELYDALLMERIRYNRYFTYSLDSCLKRIGLEKDDAVSLYIKDHKLFSTYHVEGKKQKEKDLHFDKVPYSIMLNYSMLDVINLLKLYENQLEYFNLPENKEQIDLVHSNIELTKTVFAMEKIGIQLDMKYCKEMYEKEMSLVAEKADKIEQLSQQKFKAGPKWLKEIFDAQGITLELSSKGNPILDKHALKVIPNAIAHYVLEMRDHEKRAGTYQALTRFADNNGVLHTNYRLGGTDTMRFSSSDPNLQNIEACEKGNLFTPRTAFKPRENFCFVSIDYKAMEYRLVADVAGEHGWIKAINEGADPHQFVADLMGVERTPAKTLNFMLLYGGGLAKLALSLFKCFTDEDTLKAICKRWIYKSKTTATENYLVDKVIPEILSNEIEQLKKADILKKKYFESLPAVAVFSNQVQTVAKERGYVRNQFGMRYFLGDDARFAYRLPNHLIQGTGACIIRSAMNKIAFYLEGTKSRMILQVHDELIYEVHNTEMYLIPEIKRIMEDEYKPINGMKMECDVEISNGTWNANEFKKWSA